jgi:uracil-DNA glycosylase
MPEAASAHEPFYGSAAPLVPNSGNLTLVAYHASACKACHLWLCGTQTVFGEGPQDAKLMIIGEQPGDKEDLAGRPFVGPAGNLFDSSLEEAGIERSHIYVTNVVKHFKWEASTSGKRIHGKPNRQEIIACMPWLDTEIELIKPGVIVLMGATAAQAILGTSFRLTQHRGEFVKSDAAPHVLATIHPSAILRMPTSEERSKAKAGLVSDLRLAERALNKLKKEL